MTDETDVLLARLRALRRLIPKRRGALDDAIAERREIAQRLRAAGVRFTDLQVAMGLTKSGTQRVLGDPADRRDKENDR